VSATAKVFKNGRSQAIRLPKEFRVKSLEVRLSRVPGGILISETDAWDQFESDCRKLPDEALKGMGKRTRQVVQKRDFNAGMP
jgi:antitoxin VapB